jgi:peptidoglycan hydrolase-like protein with peptidoglycan-binding domain
MKGNIVWMIQNQLSKIGLFKKNLTNNFGVETKKAVVNFQTANNDKLGDGRVVDGKVGQKTWCLLFQGTEHACKNVDTKPTEVKPTEDKPKVDEPNKMKKIPIRRFAGDDSEDNLREQSEVSVNSNTPQTPTPSEPKRYLTWAKNSGCFTEKNKINWFTIDDRNQQPNEVANQEGEMTWAITGFDDEDNSIKFFANGTFQNDSEPKSVNKWACKALKLTTSKTENPVNMDADQAEYVKNMVDRGQIQTTKPSDYETNQGKWEWIDLNRMNPTLFKEPNKHFVYRQSGLMGKLKNQYPNVEKVLNQNGWTFDEPDIDTEAYASRRDIRIQFPKYTELFPNGLYIYYTGNTRSTKQRQLVSTLMADIEKSVDSPDGKTCRDAINILWDAKQVYDKKVIYFSGDTELETVRNYVKQCQVKFERNLFRFLGGGAKDKYEELKSKKHGPNGVMKFNLSENLNSLIKKKLISLKEQKENNKIVKNIVDNRLRMIVESAKKDKNIDRLSLQFMGELNQLNKQGLVNEDFGENLKNIFGSDLSSMPKTFFENIFDKILTKINML